VRGSDEAMFAKLSNRQKMLAGFLSLPAVDEAERVALKEAYDELQATLEQYRSRRVKGD